MSDSHSPILPILIGSGVSCAAKLDGVADLSTKVTNGMQDTSGASLLTIIKEFCDKCHYPQPSNYEDWLYVATQVRDHVLRDYENPALIPFVAELATRSCLNPQDLNTACGGLIRSILTTVCVALHSGQAKPEIAYPKLVDSLRAQSETTFRFFSLNHDLLLEQIFHQSKMEYYDGFEVNEESPNNRRFSFRRSKLQKAHVSLLKLHGSINWWRQRLTRARGAANPWLYEFTGVELDYDGTFERMDQTPLISAGTFNKILQYSSPVFLQLFGEFYDTLQTSDRLLVCGYGFGDKGINTIIADWMSAGSGRHLHVVDPAPFHPDRTRGAIRGKLDQWRDNEMRVHETKAYIGKDIAWDKILATVLNSQI